MQIRKIGVNINQVVHLANQENYLHKEDIYKLKNLMDEIWKMLIGFVKQVKK